MVFILGRGEGTYGGVGMMALEKGRGILNDNDIKQ